MTAKIIIVLVTLAAGLVVPSGAYSFSSSCVMKNGKMDCTQQTDPDGNMAAGGAAIRGDQANIAAGAGTPDNFNTNRQQINYGDVDSVAPFDEPGYGGIPSNLGGGMQPNMGGGMQPNFGGGVQSNFGGGMQPNFGGGMVPNFGGGMQPNYGGGMQPNYGGGMQPNFGGGMQPNYGGGMQPNFGGGMQSNFGAGFGYGPNGVAVASSSGFPPNFVPQWNGDPFAFVQGFMRNRGRR